MTDLLVSSLMADGGLESALDAAIKKEMQAIEEKKVNSSVLFVGLCALFSCTYCTRYFLLLHPLYICLL